MAGIPEDEGYVGVGGGLHRVASGQAVHGGQNHPQSGAAAAYDNNGLASYDPSSVGYQGYYDPYQDPNADLASAVSGLGSVDLVSGGDGDAGYGVGGGAAGVGGGGGGGAADMWKPNEEMTDDMIRAFEEFVIGSGGISHYGNGHS